MVFACSAERVTKGGVGRATAQFSTQTDHNPVKSSITAQIQVNFQQFCIPFKIFFNFPPPGTYLFQTRLKGEINRDEGVIWEGGAYLILQRWWYQFWIKNLNPKWK